MGDANLKFLLLEQLGGGGGDQILDSPSETTEPSQVQPRLELCFALEPVECVVQE